MLYGSRELWHPELIMPDATARTTNRFGNSVLCLLLLPLLAVRIWTVIDYYRLRDQLEMQNKFVADTVDKLLERID